MLQKYLTSKNIILVHFFYYDKSGNGKKYPFACENSLPNSIKTDLQTCNLQTGHLDRVNSVKAELQDLQLTDWPVHKVRKAVSIEFAPSKC